MKTLKALTAALLITLSFSAFANNQTSNERLKLNYALQTYLDAISYGKLNGVSEILDDDVKLSFTQGNKIVTYNKSDILTSLRSNKNIKQNCSTDYSVVEQNATQAIIKVTMKYDNFSRINFVSLANTSDGWKITNVSSSFM